MEQIREEKWEQIAASIPARKARVKFIVDAQLPPALARTLREAGHHVQAVRELGLREASDSEIWEHALANRAVILTKDQDFAERLLAISG